MTARYFETVFHDVDRNVDVPATILLPDDSNSQPLILLSAQLVTALFSLLDLIETQTDDEETALLCQQRLAIAVEHGLTVEFGEIVSNRVH